MKTHGHEFDRRLGDIVEPFIKAREKDKIIDPGVIADLVMAALDKEGIVKNRYPDIYFAAHCAFKQTARAMLRRRYPKGGGMAESENGNGEVREKPSRQPPIPGLEIDKLQRRYPQAHIKPAKPDEDTVEAEEDDDEDRGYILREEMTEADWLWNLGQFDKDIEGRKKHREQFKQWGMKVKGWSDPDRKPEDDVGFGPRERC